jgi:hypothetical protein
VVCQAGCINHEAYHPIERHCARTGTPCIFLDRPSLSRFTTALRDGAAAGAIEAPVNAPSPSRWPQGLGA